MSRRKNFGVFHPNADHCAIDIPQGYRVLVDLADAPRLLLLSFGVRGPKSCPEVTVYDGKIIGLHRFITDAPAGISVDHINGDRMDSRRSNLRFCTTSENGGNSRVRATNALGFKGVTPRKYGFQVETRIAGQRHQIGFFKTAEDAARAYDDFVRERRGAFGRFNFPKVGEQAANAIPINYVRHGGRDK